MTFSKPKSHGKLTVACRILTVSMLEFRFYKPKSAYEVVTTQNFHTVN
jgi:hypothetical protein